MELLPIGMYQWAWNTQHLQRTTSGRLKIWTALTRLLGQLLRRNVLLLRCEANTPVRSLQNLVGNGAIPVTNITQTDHEDFSSILAAHSLCVLNTWTSNKPRTAATVTSHNIQTQTYFIITRKLGTDEAARRSKPISLDLAPWRQGESRSLLLLAFFAKQTGVSGR